MGIILLFFVSSVTPMVFGYNIETMLQDKVTDEIHKHLYNHIWDNDNLQRERYEFPVYDDFYFPRGFRYNKKVQNIYTSSDEEIFNVKKMHKMKINNLFI